MDTAQEQPVIPLGFERQPAGNSDRKIDIQVPLYVTTLNSLYVILPSHYLALTSTTYPLSPKESRDRLMNSFNTIEWPQLSSFLTQVYQAKKETLRGKPDEQAWQAELELLHQAHIRAYRGY